MLFKQKHLEAIKSGKITLAFRRWKKLAVKPGSLIKTSVGVIRITTVEEINVSQISDTEAVSAGLRDASTLIGLLGKQDEGQVYRMGVLFDSEDPRIELRETVELEEVDFVQIQKELLNLDKNSKTGKWTGKVLEAIKANPRLKAADLAVLVKREKEWLKLNVRKLKGLGLTISHEPGYSISPRGEAYLNKAGAKK
ncbi:ASCH domain-containing protein [Dyadobacter luteus]|uniref:ASCH domain-containing protein n=1 Tax=Dyadobacter luteus TaxID=2259619 RepID=A0A3D8Y8M9_9BACT|nr:ASCH domain-containing protein [Dyadobacter luteus]REA58997.1 ASCH domain-containing protein [Dyadobacter luteus]